MPDLQWLEDSLTPTTVVLGDFNAPSTRWGYDRTSAVGRAIEDFVDENPVAVIEKEGRLPTLLAYNGGKGHPDLVLAHSSLTDCLDHHLMHAPGAVGQKLLRVTWKRGHDRGKGEIPRPAVWNLKKADWKNFTAKCEERVGGLRLDGNVDQCARELTNAILKCAGETIPRGWVRKSKPFWNDNLQDLKEVKNLASTALDENGTLDNRIRVKTAAAKLRKEILQGKRTTCRKFLCELDYRKDGAKAHRPIPAWGKILLPKK